jgi:hypothetical protein
VAAAAWPVRLRDDACDLKIGLCEKMAQGRQRKVRGAAKNDSERHAALPLAGFFQLANLALDHVAFQHA